MKTAAELQSFFEGELRPELDALEAVRKKAAARIIVLDCVMGALILGSAALFIFIKFFAAIPIMLVIVAWVLIAWRMTKGYSSEFKVKVIGRIVKFIDPGLDYRPTGCIAEEAYLESGIFRHRPDRYSGDDLVVGKLGGLSVAFSELHTQYRSTTSHTGTHSSSWHTIFKGLFFIAELARTFKGRTFVLPDIAQTMLGKALGNLFQSWNKGRGRLVKMDDEEFEKQFAVYGDDENETRSILTADFMRRLLDYRLKTKRPVYLSFIGNKVYVALSFYKNMFEAKVLKTLHDFELIRGYYEDLAYAVGLAEDFNLR